MVGRRDAAHLLLGRGVSVAHLLGRGVVDADGYGAFSAASSLLLRISFIARR